MPIAGNAFAMPDLLAIPAFNDNYIWTLVDDGGHALVVDPW